MNANAKNVSRNMKCPLRHQGCLPRHKRDYKEHQKLAATQCNSDLPYARNETTFAPKKSKNEILSTRSTVALAVALSCSFAWCPGLALYGFTLWTECPRNINNKRSISIGFWNTLNSQHVGLYGGPMFFGLVSSVGQNAQETCMKE